MTNQGEQSMDAIKELATEIRDRIDYAASVFDFGVIEPDEMQGWADRMESASESDAKGIERIVRDAIIGYQDMFPRAPNDDTERELMERTTTANNWLVAHGFEPEKVVWSKEEPPCL